MEPEKVIANSHSIIQAVSFDVGGTLIKPWPSVGHLYSEVATQHGSSDLSPELLNERFKIAWQTCTEFDYTRAGWEKLVNETFAGLVPAVPFFPELYERFAEIDAWQVFDDVRPTLEYLASGQIRLIVISNWDERLRLLLERLKLKNYFESMIISCEVGFAKPSFVIFEQAAARLGLPPDSILHVGDSAEMDYQGAKAAGLQARLLHRGTDSKKPDEINSLSQLIEQVPISN